MACCHSCCSCSGSAAKEATKSVIVQEEDVPKEETKGDESGKERNEPKDNIPTGSLAEIKNLYQKKDKDGQYQWVTEYPDDVVEAAENSETAKFALLVRQKKSYDSRKKFEIDSVIIQSERLKESLGVVFAGYPGITTNLKRLVFKAPFHPFVHRWSKLTELVESTDEGEAADHLKLFRDVLHGELKDAISAKNDLIANGVITYEFLWTMFEPGCLVYSTDEGHERVYSLSHSDYTTDRQRGVDYLSLQVLGVDYDGEKFGNNCEYLSDYEFDGTRPITGLQAFPLDFHPQKERLVERLVARGKMFERFAGYHYMAYNGVALGYGRCGLIKHSVDSRIIIDCDAHNRFLPNQAVNFSPLGIAPKAERDNNSEEEYYQSEEEGASNEDDDSEGFVYTPDDEGLSKTRPSHRALTSRELLLSVPYVRGYAMKSKKWLIFFVQQITPITFSRTAFQSLVLPHEQKDLILAFVESQIKHKDTFDDIIAGKGRGMILLLSGPPGVGKTLTAESVAEDMQVPLYMMSAGDLGLDPAGIEESLNTILEMVAKWNAVLLLDEADVFLEARSTSDLERNKMVSIFLRMLEYYEGILFLTTNRIKNIDDAFHSRIHISMQYPNLTAVSRRHIWNTFMSKTSGLTDGELDALSQVELNGRQIKNVLKTAQMLARRGDGEGKVSMGHIQTILAIESGKQIGG